MAFFYAAQQYLCFKQCITLNFNVCFIPTAALEVIAHLLLVMVTQTGVGFIFPTIDTTWVYGDFLVSHRLRWQSSVKLESGLIPIGLIY